jgi:predicted short-subunit dehydrogenase-like oxidoreductase (DUF2520 family)
VTTSDPVTTEWADALVAGDLRGRAFPVPEDVRPLWHAAAVTTSNSIAAVVALGEAMLEGIGIEEGTSVLGPLAAGTVANAIEGGGGGATLTGPVVRGEAVTIKRHIAALRESAPELLDGYLRACRLVLDSARRAGRVDPEVFGDMERLLEDG